jgi:hypothetical protein
MRLVVKPNGTGRAVYTEAVELTALGRLSIARASSVEPDKIGEWWADLGRVGGPRLGPFARRSEALHAEVAWLETHWLTRPSDA